MTDSNVPNCYPNSYTDYIKMYSNVSYADTDDVVAARSWIWQTCTELGYFQTTDSGNKGIFGSTVPVDFFSDQCMDLFGKEYTLDQTYIRVGNVNKKYGGADAYWGSKVVFPNGSLDPWKSLGLLAPNDDMEIDAFVIEGTAHCADMYPASASDKQSLKDGRARILKNMDAWIKEALATTKGVQSSGFIISSLVVLIWSLCM